MNNQTRKCVACLAPVAHLPPLKNEASDGEKSILQEFCSVLLPGTLEELQRVLENEVGATCSDCEQKLASILKRNESVMEGRELIMKLSKSLGQKIEDLEADENMMLQNLEAISSPEAVESKERVSVSDSGIVFQKAIKKAKEKLTGRRMQDAMTAAVVAVNDLSRALSTTNLKCQARAEHRPVECGDSDDENITVGRVFQYKTEVLREDDNDLESESNQDSAMSRPIVEVVMKVELPEEPPEEKNRRGKKKLPEGVPEAMRDYDENGIEVIRTLRGRTIHGQHVEGFNPTSMRIRAVNKGSSVPLNNSGTLSQEDIQMQNGNRLQQTSNAKKDPKLLIGPKVELRRLEKFSNNDHSLAQLSPSPVEGIQNAPVTAAASCRPPPSNTGSISNKQTKMYNKDSKTGRFCCTLCAKSFKYTYHACHHYRSIHLGKRYNCGVCGAEYTSQQLFKSHRKRCTSVKQVLKAKYGTKYVFNFQTQKYNCVKCKKEFGTKQSCWKHYESTHLHKRYECNLCKKIFTRSQNLRTHKKNCKDLLPSRLAKKQARDADPKNKLPCKICGKKFSYKSLLSQHYNSVHLKQRNFGCDICEKSFTNPSCLKEHKEFVHFGRKFSCKYCKKDFNYARKRNFLRHERKCNFKEKN